ncbi:MAG: lysostaphin resistance A-like protein [Nodosilinea sp.]
MAALIGFFLGWLLLWFPLGLIAVWIFKIPLAYPVAPEHKLPLLLPLYLIAPVAVEGYRRYGAQTPWTAFGMVWNPAFFTTTALGFGIGGLGVLALIAVQVGLGWRRLNRPQSAPEAEARAPSLGLLVLTLLPLTLFIGGIEELIFRGVLVNGLAPTLPPGAMVIIVASLIFALSHLVWDGPAGIPQLPGLALMGAVLILARWTTGGDLSLAWGLHAGWIFAIALTDTLHLVVSTPRSPAWLAGQPDQPLTGVLALGLLLLTGLGIWGYGQWLA